MAELTDGDIIGKKVAKLCLEAVASLLIKIFFCVFDDWDQVVLLRLSPLMGFI
jgi:hypothetical protein